VFQHRTQHGDLESYFKKKLIAERSHYCECGQLETVEHILRDCALHPTERSRCLGNFFPELDLQGLLDIKKVCGAMVKSLSPLPNLLC
jgi:hypothetical protein